MNVEDLARVVLTLSVKTILETILVHAKLVTPEVHSMG